MSAIRFSRRSQQLWDAAPASLRLDQRTDQDLLFAQVRQAEVVIDIQDRVIKPAGPDGQPSRSARLDEIEQARLV